MSNYKVTNTENYEVRLNNDGLHGSFEHVRLGEESGGGLWFNDGMLTDYDGVFSLPGEVADELEVRGVDVSYLHNGE